MVPIRTFYSKDRKPLVWKFQPGNGRTEAQFEMVRTITELPAFDYMTDYKNPFGNSFRETSSLTFCHYDRDGLLHTTRIGRGGYVTRHVVTPSTKTH
ncbi:hypothetical protein ES705_10968 [subsurface metagenome]